MSDQLFSNAKINKNLVDLAPVLVPETFRSEAPQYYEMIKAFLVNIQDTYSLVGNNFIDLIDFERIQSNDVAKLYFDMYLATLNLEEDSDFLLGKDTLKVSKDLSVKKGTVVLYGLLINLLAYMFPESITNEYNELLLMLQDETLSEAQRTEIENDIEKLRLAGQTSSYVELIENQVFSYTLKAELKVEIFEKFIKPFCHPAGWHIEFYEIFRRFIVDMINPLETFRIRQTFRLPDIAANDPAIIANMHLNDVPITNYIGKYPIIHSDFLAYVTGSVEDPNRLYVDVDDMVYYDFQQITVPQFIANRSVIDYSTTSSANHIIRWTDASWEFPSDLYTVNMIYLTNQGSVIANGGFMTNNESKLISYKQVNERELNT